MTSLLFVVSWPPGLKEKVPCFAGRADIARFLVYAGADREAKDKKGKPPLTLAIREGHADVVRVLELPIEDLLEEDRHEVETLRKANQVLKEERKGLEEQSAQQQEDLEAGAAGLVAANGRIQELTAENTASEERLLAEMARAKRLEEELGALTAEMASQTATIDDYKKSMDSMQSDGAAKTELLSTQIAQLKADVDSQRAEAAAYLERTQVLAEQWREKEDELVKVKQAQGDNAQSQIRAGESLQQEIKAMQATIQQNERTLREKKLEAEKHAAAAGKISSSLRTAELQLEKERDQKAQRDEKIKELECTVGVAETGKQEKADLLEKAEYRAKRAEEERERHKIALNDLTVKQKELWTELENTRREKREARGKGSKSGMEDKVKEAEGLAKLEVDRKAFENDKLALKQDQSKLAAQTKELKEWKQTVTEEKEDMGAEWERLKSERQELLNERLQFEQQRRR